MSIMSLKDLLIGIFILMPIIYFIHELGHAFFVKLFRCKLKKIVIGSGKELFTIGIITVCVIYFLSGYFTAEKLGNRKVTQIIILLGGVIFNILSCIILFLLINFKIIHRNQIFNLFIEFSILIVLTAAIPVKYVGGRNSDGLQVYQIIKYGTSKFIN